jgi:HD-GYP domain-containing protein (c-di-GMP phosphodiesterase class II)
MTPSSNSPATRPEPPRLRPLATEHAATMGERLAALHRQMIAVVPEVDQIACVLYDADTDLLKTYVDSSRGGDPLQGYEFPLSGSRSLSELAATRRTRVLDDIPAQATRGSVHSARLVEAGFRSSYTVPLFDGEQLQGFLFMDSRQPAIFTESVIDQLGVYVSLVRMLICHHLTAMRSLVGSVRIAREFARLHDADSAGHLERMARYARLIARRLASRHGRNDEFVEQVFLFAPLHDIGKLGIPTGILHKPRSLTARERAVMATHVELGMEVVEKLIGHFRLEHLAGIEVLRNIVGGHHELLDGSGYPAGLRGDAIPLEARIVTVADIFDALSSQRDYKRAWSTASAFEHLEAMAAAGKIDPECVAALAESQEAIGEIMRRYTL